MCRPVSTALPARSSRLALASFAATPCPDPVVKRAHVRRLQWAGATAARVCLRADADRLAGAAPCRAGLGVRRSRVRADLRARLLRLSSASRAFVRTVCCADAGLRAVCRTLYRRGNRGGHGDRAGLAMEPVCQSMARGPCRCRCPDGSHVVRRGQWDRRAVECGAGRRGAATRGGRGVGRHRLRSRTESVNSRRSGQRGTSPGSRLRHLPQNEYGILVTSPIMG